MINQEEVYDFDEKDEVEEVSVKKMNSSFNSSKVNFYDSDDLSYGGEEEEEEEENNYLSDEGIDANAPDTDNGGES